MEIHYLTNKKIGARLLIIVNLTYRKIRYIDTKNKKHTRNLTRHFYYLKRHYINSEVYKLVNPEIARKRIKKAGFNELIMPRQLSLFSTQLSLEM